MTDIAYNPSSILPPREAECRALARGREDRVRPAWFHSRSVLLRQLANELRGALGTARRLVSTDPDAECTLLDVGCGRGPYAAMVRASFGSYVGADLEWNADAGITLGDDGMIPLADHAMDAALSTQVLHTVADPPAHLREIRRVLRPGGAIIVSANAVWPWVPEPVDRRRWTLEGLRLELEDVGFRIVEERSVLGLAGTAVQLMQDAVSRRAPGFARGAVAAAGQTAVRLSELTRRRSANANACINIVTAQRGPGS